MQKVGTENLEKVLCDKIIKYENLNKELSVVFNKLDISFGDKLEFFKKKRKGEKNYKKFYDNKSKKLIEKIFRKEIEMFGYKF